MDGGEEGYGRICGVTGRGGRDVMLPYLYSSIIGAVFPPGLVFTNDDLRKIWLVWFELFLFHVANILKYSYILLL